MYYRLKPIGATLLFDFYFCSNTPDTTKYETFIQKKTYDHIFEITPWTLINLTIQTQWTYADMATRIHMDTIYTEIIQHIY